MAFRELVLLLAVTMFGSYLFFILFPVDSPYYRSEPLGPPFAGNFFFDLVHGFLPEAAPGEERFRAHMSQARL